MTINAGQALAQVLVDELARCGMTHACIAPGSRSTPLVLALAARPEVELHVCIDERSASFLALGIAKQLRQPAVVGTTSGTAAANLYPAVVEAHHARVPLILLTADRPPELRDTGAGQTIDQIKLYGNAVRWFVEVGIAEERPESVPYWRSIASRAYYTSAGPNPGPVHLNLPFHQPFVPRAGEASLAHQLEGRPEGQPWTRVTRGTAVLDESDARALRQEIVAAERGVVVAGTGDLAAEPVLSLARGAGWPLLAEASSNVRAGWPAISTYDALLREASFVASHRPELVVRIGNLGTSPSLNSLLDPSVRQIAIAPEGVWLDPRRGVSWVVRSDPEQLCRTLSSGLSPRRRSRWFDGWLEAEESARRAMDAVLDDHEEVTEPQAARDLAAGIPDGSNLVVASSMPIRDLDWFMRPRSGIRVHANRGANGIDGFVSTALGVALVAPGRTYALCGDLALLHDQNGLLLNVSESVDAVFVVINNNGGGIFSFLPQAEEAEFERLFATPHNIDLSLVAQTYRCGYRLLEKASELEQALEEAAQIGGVQIIEARTDRNANVEIHREVWAAVADAVGGRDAG